MSFIMPRYLNDYYYLELMIKYNIILNINMNSNYTFFT